jgi:ribosomal protein S18 acetylase RimI-like enzyme
MNTGVRKATVADVKPISQALARAFHDDPVLTWLFPDERTAPTKMPKFFAVDLSKFWLGLGEVYTADASSGDSVAGGALWGPPGHWQMGMGTIIRNGPTMIRLLGGRLFKGLQFLSMVEKAHPKEPHFYLAILGTQPADQGKGLGSAMMAPVLERCDSERTPAYLESSKESNIPFYRRHGFEVTQELAFPGGPTVWGMWRDPRG